MNADAVALYDITDLSWMMPGRDIPGMRLLSGRCAIAHLAALAYEERPALETALSRIGFDLLDYPAIDDTEFFVAGSARLKIAIIVFQGTRNLADWKRNFKFTKNTHYVGEHRLRLHRGFVEALSVAEHRFLYWLRRLNGEGYRVWLYGHSQGAPVALWAGIRNRDLVQGVGQLAPARLGDASVPTVVRALNLPVVSICSFFDGVTWQPPWPLSRHADRLYLVDTLDDSIPDEVARIREGHALLLRWYHVGLYIAHLTGAALGDILSYGVFLQRLRQISRAWKEHTASAHYAALYRAMLAREGL